MFSPGIERSIARKRWRAYGDGRKLALDPVVRKA